MKRLNQPSKTECCTKEGQADVAEGDASRTTFVKRTQGTSQAVSGSRTPLKLSSLETPNAGGDAVASAEPNTQAVARGETGGDLPGSKRMAREARADGNLGDPGKSQRANCGHETGRGVQRQEARSEAHPGVRSVHSNPPQAGEGADMSTPPAQETSAVRTTEQSWTTSLWVSRRVEMKSPVRENRPPGSVRGAPGNRRPYRDHLQREGSSQYLTKSA